MKLLVPLSLVATLVVVALLAVGRRGDLVVNQYVGTWNSNTTTSQFGSQRVQIEFFRDGCYRSYLSSPGLGSIAQARGEQLRWEGCYQISSTEVVLACPDLPEAWRFVRDGERLLWFDFVLERSSSINHPCPRDSHDTDPGLFEGPVFALSWGQGPR